MKERILKNWSIIRVVYILLGGMIIVQSVLSSEWLLVAFGSYFAVMGIFAFGCASGNCKVDQK